MSEQQGPPNRDHLVGRRVKVKLHRWANRSQPTEGTFTGQGEKGLSITVEGGGRWTFRHAEVKSVDLA